MNLRAISLIAFAALTLSTIAQAQPAWTSDLQPLGWRYLSADENNAYYIRPATGQSRRLWVRQEFQTQQSYAQYRWTSVVSLMEFDCVGGRSRILQQSQYPRRNMAGEPTVITTPSQWVYDIPGTTGEHFREYTCRATTTRP